VTAAITTANNVVAFQTPYGDENATTSSSPSGFIARQKSRELSNLAPAATLGTGLAQSLYKVAWQWTLLAVAKFDGEVFIYGR
jgi:hypothetical protein